MENRMQDGRWRIAVWGLIAVIIATPAVAMRFTDQVAWTISDFVFAAVLLGGAGLAYELAVRLTARPLYRALIAGVLVLGVLLIWAEAAVGILH